jgi:hypothetical protein
MMRAVSSGSPCAEQVAEDAQPVSARRGPICLHVHARTALEMA